MSTASVNKTSRTLNSTAYHQQGVRMGVAAVGFGVLLGSTWSARSLELFHEAWSQPLVHIVAIVTLVILAVSFLHRAPRVKSFVKVLIALFVGHLITVLLTFAFEGPDEILALSLVSSLFGGMFFGVASALLTLKFVSFDRKVAAVGIAFAFLAANIYDCFFINAAQSAVAVQWLGGRVVSLIAIALLYKNEMTTHDKTEEPLDESWLYAVDPVRRSGEELHARSYKSFVPFACVVAVLMLIQGLFASATGFGGIGEYAFFNMSHGIFLVGVRFVLLIICFAAFRVLTSQVVSAMAITAWVVGLACTALLWNFYSDMVGASVLEAALYGLQVLSLIVGVQIAREMEADAFSVVCIFAALASFNQPTRLLGYFLFGTQGIVNQEIASFLVVGALSIIALMVLVLLVFEWHKERNGITLDALPELDPVIAQLDLNAIKREVDFSKRFRLVCDKGALTEREREVLLEILHGYTIESAADKLCLSKETVKTYLSRTYAKVGVNNKQGVLNLMDSFTCE